MHLLCDCNYNLLSILKYIIIIFPGHDNLVLNYIILPGQERFTNGKYTLSWVYSLGWVVVAYANTYEYFIVGSKL